MNVNIERYLWEQNMNVDVVFYRGDVVFELEEINEKNEDLP